MKMPKISPFLWYANEAEEAARHYAHAGKAAR